MEVVIAISFVTTKFYFRVKSQVILYNIIVNCSNIVNSGSIIIIYIISLKPGYIKEYLILFK